MSSGDYLDALASERSHSAKLTKIIFGIVGLAVAGMWLAARSKEYRLARRARY